AAAGPGSGRGDGTRRVHRRHGPRNVAARGPGRQPPHAVRSARRAAGHPPRRRGRRLALCAGTCRAAPPALRARWPPVADLSGRPHDRQPARPRARSHARPDPWRRRAQPAAGRVPPARDLVRAAAAPWRAALPDHFFRRARGRARGALRARCALPLHRPARVRRPGARDLRPRAPGEPRAHRGRPLRAAVRRRRRRPLHQGVPRRRARGDHSKCEPRVARSHRPDPRGRLALRRRRARFAGEDAAGAAAAEGAAMTRLFLILLVSVFASGCATGEPAVLRYGVQDAPEGKRLMWPPAPEVPRYLYAGQLVGEANFRSPAAGAAEGLKGILRAIAGLVVGESKPLELQRPQSGTVDRDGRIYVTDASRQAVMVFDPVAGKLDVWEKAEGLANFAAPVALAVGKGVTVGKDLV